MFTITRRCAPVMFATRSGHLYMPRNMPALTILSRPGLIVASQPQPCFRSYPILHTHPILHDIPRRQIRFYCSASESDLDSQAQKEIQRKSRLVSAGKIVLYPAMAAVMLILTGMALVVGVLILYVAFRLVVFGINLMGNIVDTLLGPGWW